jgi:hypothetical protein
VRTDFGLRHNASCLKHSARKKESSLPRVMPGVMSGRQTHKLCGRAAALAAIKAGITDVVILKDLDRATHMTARPSAGSQGWRLAHGHQV